MNRFSIGASRAGRIVFLGGALLVSSASHAVRFEIGEHITGSFDSTFTAGAAFRAEKPDDDLLYSRTNPQGQIGNAQFDKWDPVSASLKGTHELLLDFGQTYSAFVRGTWFYDEVNAKTLDRSDGLLDYGAAMNRARDHADILDAYVLARYSFAGRPLSLKLGQQVISWGESTFIGNSLNVINPVDVSKLRLAGAELKDGLVPVNAFYANYGVTPNIQLETFYLLDFEETLPDPAGVYWSSAWFLFDGGEEIRAAPRPGGGFIKLDRTADDHAEWNNQYGVALRYYSYELDSEFSLYYMNLHSTALNIGARSTGPAPVPVASRADPGATDLVVGEYFLTYAQNVDIAGVAFNTRLGSYAVSGEYSYRDNAPVQFGNFRDPSLGGTVPAGMEIDTIGRLKISQMQFTGQRILGPRFGYDQLSVIGEVGFNYVHNRDRYDNDRYFDPFSDFSWGYQVRASATYNRALFNLVNLTPGLAYRQDVNGESSELGGARTFREGRKQASVSLGWDYKTNWFGEISYNWFWGARGDGNPFTDRDFIALSVSYQL